MFSRPKLQLAELRDFHPSQSRIARVSTTLSIIREDIDESPMVPRT